MSGDTHDEFTIRWHDGDESRYSVSTSDLETTRVVSLALYDEVRQRADLLESRETALHQVLNTYDAPWYDKPGPMAGEGEGRLNVVGRTHDVLKRERRRIEILENALKHYAEHAYPEVMRQLEEEL